jgi:hypothetical protein
VIRAVSVVVSFPSVLNRSAAFASERHGRADALGERPSDDLLSGWTETVNSIVTTAACLSFC